jgi:hypothetical protein
MRPAHVYDKNCLKEQQNSGADLNWQFETAQRIIGEIRVSPKVYVGFGSQMAEKAFRLMRSQTNEKIAQPATFPESIRSRI